MPIKTLIQPIEADRYYHLYNRGNNRQKLFFVNNDYYFFLNRLKYYCDDFLYLIAFSLIPNHFHLLIKTKAIDNKLFSKVISNQLRKVFITYAMTINSREGRSGSLFTRHIRRIEVKDELYLRYLMFYIHYNPQRHKVVSNFKSYQFSSFRYYNSVKSNTVFTSGGMSFFNNDRKEFLDFHHYLHNEKIIKELTHES